MKPSGEKILDVVYPRGVDVLAARQFDEQAPSTETFLAGRRYEAVQPMTGQLFKRGDQVIKEIQGLFFARFQNELPENMGFRTHESANECGNFFALCEKA